MAVHAQLQCLITGGAIDMIRQSEVQKLENEAKELTGKVLEQEEEIRKHVEELHLLRCRTPRPAWQDLCAELHAHGVIVKDGSDQATSSSQFAETLTKKLKTCIGELEVGAGSWRMSSSGV
jgi:hypothetical protein